MNLTKNQKIAYAISAVVLVIVIAWFTVPWGLIRSAFYVAGLNDNQAIERLSLIATGQVTDIGDGGFVILAGDDYLVIHTDEQAIFSQSLSVQGYAESATYKKEDIQLGSVVTVTGVVLEGQFWADSVALR